MPKPSHTAASPSPLLRAQVHWQCDEQPKELNFYSVSSDGRVANWIMSKNELKMEPVMQLKLVGGAREEPEVRHPSHLVVT